MTEQANRPEPYLWMAHLDGIDDPMLFLPLESEMDSEIWEDDGIEIEIVTWSRD